MASHETNNTDHPTTTVKLEPGEKLCLCRCFASAKFPFCDDAHIAQPGKGPVEVEALPAQAKTTAARTPLKRSPDQEHLARLRQTITANLDEQKLRLLCAALKIDYGNLSSNAKAGKVIEMLQYLQRQVRLSELIEIGKRMYPDVTWDDGDK